MSSSLLTSLKRPRSPVTELPPIAVLSDSEAKPKKKARFEEFDSDEDQLDKDQYFLSKPEGTTVKQKFIELHRDEHAHSQIGENPYLHSRNPGDALKRPRCPPPACVQAYLTPPPTPDTESPPSDPVTVTEDDSAAKAAVVKDYRPLFQLYAQQNDKIARHNLRHVRDSQRCVRLQTIVDTTPLATPASTTTSSIQRPVFNRQREYSGANSVPASPTLLSSRLDGVHLEDSDEHASEKVEDVTLNVNDSFASLHFDPQAGFAGRETGISQPPHSFNQAEQPPVASGSLVSIDTAPSAETTATTICVSPTATSTHLFGQDAPALNSSVGVHLDAPIAKHALVYSEIEMADNSNSFVLDMFADEIQTPEEEKTFRESIRRHEEVRAKQMKEAEEREKERKALTRKYLPSCARGKARQRSRTPKVAFVGEAYGNATEEKLSGNVDSVMSIGNNYIGASSGECSTSANPAIDASELFVPQPLDGITEDEHDGSLFSGEDVEMECDEQPSCALADQTSSECDDVSSAPTFEKELPAPAASEIKSEKRPSSKKNLKDEDLLFNKKTEHKFRELDKGPSVYDTTKSKYLPLGSRSSVTRPHAPVHNPPAPQRSVSKNAKNAKVSSAITSSYKSYAHYPKDR